MRHLPTPDQRLWLIECLAELLRDHGPAPMLEAPVLRLQDLSPPASGGARDAAAWVHDLIDQMMRHVQLESVGYELELRAGSALNRTLVHTGSALQRLASGVSLALEAPPTALRFQVDPSQLARAWTPGVIAHAVVGAWRATHGLVYPHARAEALLTDLTAVYLGLGALCADLPAALRVPSPGHAQRDAALSPQEMGYALAAQARARRMTMVARWRLARQLAGPTRAAFRHGCRRLRRRRSLLEARLGLRELPLASRQLQLQG